MSIRFKYDKDLRMLLTTAEGPVSFEDILAHINEESQARALGYRELVDASEARTHLTADQVRLLVDRILTMMRTTALGPTAIVVNNDVLFGMASMFTILLDLQGGPYVGVFRSMNEALSWLVQYQTLQ
jgi:hypothetical protein